MEIKQAKEYAITALIIVMVIAVGLFALNQAFAWYYKSEFLLQPCGLCLKAHPNVMIIPKEVDFNNFNINLSSAAGTG